MTMKRPDGIKNDYNLAERSEKALALLEELFGRPVLKKEDIPYVEVYDSVSIEKITDKKFETMIAESSVGKLGANAEDFKTETAMEIQTDYRKKQRPVWYDKDRDVILLDEKALLPYQKKGFFNKLFGTDMSRDGLDPYGKGLDKEIELLILRGLLLKVLETRHGYDLKYEKFKNYVSEREGFFSSGIGRKFNTGNGFLSNKTRGIYFEMERQAFSGLDAFLTIDNLEYGLAKMMERKAGNGDEYRDAEEKIDIKFGEKLEGKKGKIKIRHSNLDEAITRLFVEELGRTFLDRGKFDEYMRYAANKESIGSQAIIRPTAVELPTLEGPVLYFPNFNAVLQSVINEKNLGKDVVVEPRVLTFRKFDKDLENRWSEDILYITRNIRAGYDQNIHMIHAQSESSKRFFYYIGVGGTLSYPFWLYMTHGPVPMLAPSIGSAMFALMFYSFLKQGPKTEEKNLKYMDEAFSNFSNNITEFDYEVDESLGNLKEKLLTSKAKSDIELYKELKNYSRDAGIDPAYRLYKNIIEKYEKNEENSEKVWKRTLGKKILSLRLLPLAVWHGLFAAGVISASTYFGIGAMAAWFPLMLPSYEQVKSQIKAAKMATRRNDYVFAPKHVLEASCIPQVVSEKWDLYQERRAYGMAGYSLSDKVMQKFMDMIENPYKIMTRDKK